MPRLHPQRLSARLARLAVSALSALSALLASCVGVNDPVVSVTQGTLIRNVTVVDTRD